MQFIVNTLITTFVLQYLALYDIKLVKYLYHTIKRCKIFKISFVNNIKYIIFININWIALLNNRLSIIYIQDFNQLRQ